jgi:hypothetical protein
VEVTNGSFAALMGTIGSGDQIWQFHHHSCIRMGVVSERAQGFGQKQWGGRESVPMVVIDRVTGVVVSQW